MFKQIDKKKLLIILSFIPVIVIAIVLNNYTNPSVEASIQNEYTWMEDVEVLQTDWYGNKGLTFFVAKGFSNNEENLCKGYVSKSIFNTKTSWYGCVPISNSSKEGAKTGVYGTSEFFGKPLVSGFTLATTNIKVQDKEVKSYIYGDLNAWYVFSSPAEPTFHFDK